MAESDALFIEGDSVSIETYAIEWRVTRFIQFETPTSAIESSDYSSLCPLRTRDGYFCFKFEPPNLHFYKVCYPVSVIKSIKYNNLKILSSNGDSLYEPEGDHDIWTTQCNVTFRKVGQESINTPFWIFVNISLELESLMEVPRSDRLPHKHEWSLSFLDDGMKHDVDCRELFQVFPEFVSVIKEHVFNVKPENQLNLPYRIFKILLNGDFPTDYDDIKKLLIYSQEKKMEALKYKCFISMWPIIDQDNVKDISSMAVKYDYQLLKDKTDFYLKINNLPA